MKLVKIVGKLKGGGCYRGRIVGVLLMTLLLALHSDAQPAIQPFKASRIWGTQGVVMRWGASLAVITPEGVIYFPDVNATSANAFIPLFDLCDISLAARIEAAGKARLPQGAPDVSPASIRAPVRTTQPSG